MCIRDRPDIEGPQQGEQTGDLERLGQQISHRGRLSHLSPNLADLEVALPAVVAQRMVGWTGVFLPRTVALEAPGGGAVRAQMVGIGGNVGRLPPQGDY